LLLYDGEGHSLMEGKNQKDLSDRIRQWFGHYLKAEPEPDWMGTK